MKQLPGIGVAANLGALTIRQPGGSAMSQKHSCENCVLRARADKNPNGLLGRIWRWHAGWCPGFKKYITSLPDEQRNELAQRYCLKKYGG